MIQSGDRKITAKQKASLTWESHLDGTCAWSEWIDEESFEKMSQKEHDEVMRQMEKLYRRMRKMLKKARGER